MDTKLKELRYSTSTKVIAVILVWLCFMSAVASGIFLLYKEDIFTSKSYFESRGFTSEYSTLIYDAAKLHMGTNGTKSTNGALQGSAQENEELKKHLKDKLDGAVNFSYYIKDSATGTVISNVSAADPVALLKKQASYMHFNNQRVSGKYQWYSSDIMDMLSNTTYEMHTAVVEPLKQGDVFYDDYMHFYKLKYSIPYIIALISVSLAVMLAAFVYLVYVAGRREKNGEIVLNAVDRIYTDVHTLLVFIAAIISIMIVTNVSSVSDMFFFIVAAIVLSIDVFIGLSYVLSMVRQFKNGQLISNSWTGKLFSTAKRFMVLAFSGKLFKAWILLVLLGYGAVNGVLFAVFLSTSRHSDSFEVIFSWLLLIACNAAAVYFTAKALKSLTQIMEAAKELSCGNLDYTLDSKEMSVAFVGFANDLQGIQAGLKKAVAEAVKGERMKTELITNVSHDLKTPLTSIINYVDLLKKEALDNQNAEEYVAILEEKAARLKQLVEDLIEASKATSGNLSINAEKVDLQQLVMQAYGEYEEKIEDAGLDIRTNAPDASVLVYADGKHLWRVVENLLSNALKYSMTNSRVYINIDKNEKYGVLTIKNISAFPLEISPEQLTERFIRGDASRTTEGSGLGLSIAQGLTNLQGGRFKIEIDGDLFKATVEIPLWVEE